MQSYSHTRANNVYWTCTCLLCGASCTHPRSHLVSGTVKSCGCSKEDYLSYGQFLDLVHSRPGFLLPLKYWSRVEQQRVLKVSKRNFWLCLCQCGQFIETSTTALRTHKVLSCPDCAGQAEAARQETLFQQWEKDYLEDTPEKRKEQDLKRTRDSHHNMKGRVKRDPGYSHVTICPQWLGRGGLAQFISDMGLCPKFHSLDRKDPRGPYEPANCHYVTWAEQARNKRNSVVYLVDGTPMNHVDLSTGLGLTPGVTRRRLNALIKQGMTTDEAATHLSLSTHPAHRADFTNAA